MQADAVDPRVRRTNRDVVQAVSEIILEDGWSAISHAEVARRAGYAKATIYAHWPTQLDLVRDAILQICADDDQHHTPTGDLRGDLIAELAGFGQVLTKGHLSRVLGGLLERAGTDPEIEALRRQLQLDGSRVLYDILRAHLDPNDVEPVALMLGGAVLYRATLQARVPSRQFIEDMVDRVLAGIVLPGRSQVS